MPNRFTQEFHKECVRKVTRLHDWDVLRANKATFAFGLEARVPFLDKKFLNIAMTMDAAEKMASRLSLVLSRLPFSNQFSIVSTHAYRKHGLAQANPSGIRSAPLPLKHESYHLRIALPGQHHPASCVYACLAACLAKP